jgi:hypothetical protein
VALLCREKRVREDRKRVLGAAGVATNATGDPDLDVASTNLYVSNMFRTVNEQVLMETFGRYGPLASVKIMWPRKEEDDGTKTHNSGFVAFMVRPSWGAFMLVAVQSLHRQIHCRDTVNSRDSGTLHRRQS